MAAALMHRGLEHAAARFGDRDAVLAGDERWSFGELDARANAFAHHLAAGGVGRRRSGGGDDLQPARVRGRRARHQQARRRRRAAEPGVEGDRGRPRHRARPTPVHAVADGAAVGLAGRAPRARPRRPTSTTTRRSWRCSRPAASVRPTRRRSRHRRGRAGVQLGHDRAAQGGAPHPPLDRPRHARTGVAALGLGPDDRFQVATPPSHILGLLNLLAAAVGRRHRAAAPPVRPRRGAAPHRVRPHDARDGGRADRAGHGQPPAPRGLRPLVAALHHVGRHAGERERGRGGHRAHRRALAARLRRQRAAGDRRQPGRRSRRVAARLGRPAPGGRRAAGGRPRHRRDPGPGRDRRDPGPQPVGDGRLPAGRGDRRRLRRRLVPHRRRRLARARGLGPPHRPVQGDDQGQRLPGGAGRDRGGAARPSRGARLRGVRHPRRAGRRGAGGRRAARSRTRPVADDELQRAGRRLAGDLQARCATSWWSTPSRGCRRARCCAARCATSGRRRWWRPGRTADGRPTLRRAAGAARLGRAGRRPARPAGRRRSSTTASGPPSSTPPSPRRAGASCACAADDGAPLASGVEVAIVAEELGRGLADAAVPRPDAGRRAAPAGRRAAGRRRPRRSPSTRRSGGAGRGRSTAQLAPAAVAIDAHGRRRRRWCSSAATAARRSARSPLQPGGGAHRPHPPDRRRPTRRPTPVAVGRPGPGAHRRRPRRAGPRSGWP